MKFTLGVIAACMTFQMNAMQSEVRVCDSDSGDEPAILQIIRDDREILIRHPGFNEVAMITKKSMSPDTDEKNGSLAFKVIKNKDEVLGFTAYHATATNAVQIALVAIDKNHRGKKNAQRLLASTINGIRTEIKQPVDIWAYVAKDNVAAQRVWKKVAGTIPDATLHWVEGTGKTSDAFIVHLK